MKKTAFAAAVLTLAACSDADGARRTLERHGFTEITTTGWSLWGCDSGKHSGDTFVTGFNAKALNGERVEGVVCSGWFKGATVRLFD